MTDPSHDHVLRAVTDDGAFRVIAARTTETARGILAAQNVERGDVSVLLADLVAAAVLMRELMSPGLRVQALFVGSNERHRLVADALPDGRCRGLVQLPAGMSMRAAFGERARLHMMRTLYHGGLQQGVTEWQEGSSMSGSLQEYLQISEQVVATAAIGQVRGEDGTLQLAGGYVVQLLPEVSRDRLGPLTTRLAELPPFEQMLAEGGGDPETVAQRICGDVAFTQTARSEVRFGCLCSEERVLTSLTTLPHEEIRDIVEKGESLDITCDYCNVHYGISPERLRALLTPS